MNGMNTAPYQDFAREKLGFEFYEFGFADYSFDSP